MAIYSQLFLYIDGQLLSENVTIETSLDSPGDEDVFDMRKGWAGMSAGPLFRSISANNVVPSFGTEFSFEQYYARRQKVEILLYETSGVSVRSQGFFTSVRRTSGVGQNMSVSFTFRGTAEAIPG